MINGEMHIYFTNKGPAYHINKYDYKEDTEEGRHEVRELMEKELRKNVAGIDFAKLEKYFINRSSYINIEWVGSNQEAQIEVKDEVNEYFTYSLIKGKESIPVKAKAYKKLVYKNTSTPIPITNTPLLLLVNGICILTPGVSIIGGSCRAWDTTVSTRRRTS